MSRIFLPGTIFSWLMDLKTGQQPMVSSDTERAVVFNGEIYNFKELKNSAKDYTFRTQSDTELLLSLKDLLHPQDFLDSLRGMFSFCLVDYKNDLILVARDRFGKKPLFCGNIGGHFFASSRLKTIQAMTSPHSPPVSAFGLGYFVDFGFIPAPFSMLEGIEKLLPGEWRVYNLSGQQRRKGFIASRSLPYSINYAQTRHMTNEIFEHTMQMSIQSRLNSERPIGLLLSDGVDSSIIAKMLVDLQNAGKAENIKAIILSSGDEFDESEGAARFARNIGLNYEIASMDLMGNNIQSTLDILDEPFADLSIFPTFKAFKALKSYATVALTGDGGDELFGGYPYQYQNRFLYDALPFPSYYGILRRLKLFKDLPHALSKPAYLYRRLSNSGLFHSPYYRKYSDQIPKPRDRFEALIASRPDFITGGDISLSQWNNSVSLGLSDRMLTKVDVCSMGAGVEARSPFLDEDLWNLIMLSDATQTDQLYAKCKTFLKTYLEPYKPVGTKRGFSMNYERLMSSNAKSRHSIVSARFLSDSTPAQIADKIMHNWNVQR